MKNWFLVLLFLSFLIVPSVYAYDTLFGYNASTAVYYGFGAGTDGATERYQWECFNSSAYGISGEWNISYVNWYQASETSADLPTYNFTIHLFDPETNLPNTSIYYDSAGDLCRLTFDPDDYTDGAYSGQVAFDSSCIYDFSLRPEICVLVRAVTNPGSDKKFFVSGLNGDSDEAFSQWSRDGTPGEAPQVGNVLARSPNIVFFGSQVITPTYNFSLYLHDNRTLETILNFGALINGTYYNTSDGVIETPLELKNTFVNITINSSGYLNRSYFDVNISSYLNASLITSYLNVSFSNNLTVWGSNYVKSLNYSFIVNNCNGIVLMRSWVNGVRHSEETQDCGVPMVADMYGIFNFSDSKPYNVSFSFESLYGQTNINRNSSNYTFFVVLDSPDVVSSSYSVTEGFLNTSSFNGSLVCNSSMSNLTYRLLFNSVVLHNANHSINELVSVNSSLINGVNVFNVSCFDAFGSSDSSVSSFSAYVKNIILWDEINNVPFDVYNLSIARLWFADNSSFFDFKDGNKTNVSIVTLNNYRVRFELGTYNIVVNRYIDLSLVSSDSLRVCANKEGVNHYQLLLTSGAEKTALLRNAYSNCYIAADSTYFAYQDSYVLQAQAIDSLYYLSTIDDGKVVYLASIDGSLAAYINLDNLIFNLKGYNTNLYSDALSFSKYSNTSIKIYYNNLREDNENLTFSIYRLDTDERVLFIDSFNDTNEFLMYFDTASLSGVNSTTLFKGVVYREFIGGSETINRFFDLSASVGVVPSPFSIAIAFLLIVFGLTFVTSSYALSWFGVFICLGGLTVLSMAVNTWYIKFFSVVVSIILVYIVLMLSIKNYPTVA